MRWKIIKTQQAKNDIFISISSKHVLANVKNLFFHYLNSKRKQEKLVSLAEVTMKESLYIKLKLSTTKVQQKICKKQFCKWSWIRKRCCVPVNEVSSRRCFCQVFMAYLYLSTWVESIYLSNGKKVLLMHFTIT